MNDTLAGEAKFKRRLRAIPDKVRAEVVAAMEKAAEAVVQDMRLFAPKGTSLQLVNSIGWTWGEAPAGTITVGELRGRVYDALRITIYAGGGRAFYAVFQEFGTVNMPANPFFYPSWRANKRRVRSRIGAAVRRGFRKS